MTYDIASAAVTDNSQCVLILSTLLREEDEETKVFWGFFYVIETFMNRQSILKEFLKKQKADLKSKLAEFIWIFKPIFGLPKNLLISPALGCSSM